jgi:hypothetical protein
MKTITKVNRMFNSLCSPSRLYLVLSTVSILALLVQNYAEPQKYRVGRYSVNLQHNNLLFFAFKIMYVLVWTFLLNKLCMHGYGNISWFLVLLPFILMFVLIGLLILTNM